MEDEMELSAIQNLLRERDRLNDILELLENGEIEKAEKKLRRDINTITEALESR